MKKRLLQGVRLLSFFFASYSQNHVYAALKDEIAFNFYLQGDSINFWGDTRDYINPRKNLHDGVNSPRARFIVTGSHDGMAYRFSFDAAEVRVREAYLRYEEYNFFRITLGQEKSAYNFWFESTISKLNFLERALPSNAFNPGFRTGLQAKFFSNSTAISLGVLGPELDNKINNNQLKGHVPLAVNGRLAFSPIHTEKELLHFGQAIIIQYPDSLKRFRFKSFPEVQTNQNVSLVDTGYIYHCQNYAGLESEVVTMVGPLTLSAEYYYTHIKRTPENLNFNGFFVTADYFLTGEHYIYNFQNGGMDTISRIKHSYGAWQLAARFSWLDLTSGIIQGGRESNTTLGVNWLPNDYLKFMLNYIHVNTFPAENSLNRHVNIVGLRCQLSTQR